MRLQYGGRGRCLQGLHPLDHYKPLNRQSFFYDGTLSFGPMSWQQCHGSTQSTPTSLRGLSPSNLHLRQWRRPSNGVIVARHNRPLNRLPVNRSNSQPLRRDGRDGLDG